MSALTEQEREDAMTIGRLSEANRQNASNISTLFDKFDKLTEEMHSLSTRLAVIVGIASVVSPLLYSLITHYVFK
jgi:hypothetical protein